MLPPTRLLRSFGEHQRFANRALQRVDLRTDGAVAHAVLAGFEAVQVSGLTATLLLRRHNMLWPERRGTIRTQDSAIFRRDFGTPSEGGAPFSIRSIHSASFADEPMTLSMA